MTDTFDTGDDMNDLADALTNCPLCGKGNGECRCMQEALNSLSASPRYHGGGEQEPLSTAPGEAPARTGEGAALLPSAAPCLPSRVDADVYWKPCKGGCGMDLYWNQLPGTPRDDAKTTDFCDDCLAQKEAPPEGGASDHGCGAEIV